MGGVGSPWPWAVLAWAALLVAIIVSFRPAVPIIWGDTPSFVESALRTLEAGRPTVADGRDPGYPAFLAVTFAFGGDLGTVVRMQQAAWAVLMLALAATAQAATRNAAALVPLILVATYPGLLLFRNVLTAELLFAVFLNLAMAGLLVATCVGKAARCWLVGASVLCAALAACFRSQGVLVPIAAVLVGARLARPDTSARLAVIAVSVARVSLEARDQHQRAVHAHDPNHLAQDVLLAPFLQGFVEPLGEAVIDDAREVLVVDAIVAVGQEQLLGADEAEAVEQLGADRVVSRLSPVEREQGRPRAQAPADPGQDPAVLVVRMSGGMHRARRRPQLQELLPGAGGATVGAERARRLTGDAGRERSQQRADPEEPRPASDHVERGGG